MVTPCKYSSYTSIEHILVIDDKLNTTQKVSYYNERSRILAPLKTAEKTQEVGESLIAETDTFRCFDENSTFFERDVTLYVIGLTVIDGDATWSDGTKYDASIYDIKFADNNSSGTAYSST